MSGIFNHLRVTSWPFSVVPRPEFCTYIAGRPQLDSDIRELLHNLSRRDTSSIHAFWSWFGAGKTHSLYYLANRAKELNGNASPFNLYPVYTEFPRSVRNFVDLYKAFVTSLDLSIVQNAFLELHTSPKPDSYYDKLLSSSPDLATALRVFATGSPQEQSTASRWLKGDMIPLAEYRRIGIYQRITTPDSAIRTLSSIINLLSSAERARERHGHRLIWAIDELQRLALTGKATTLDINASLHSLFNACPTGLSLVLSFSGHPDQSALPSWLGNELKDRMGVTKVMVMPPLQQSEARQFVADVLHHFRPPAYSCSPLFPFSEQACTEILEFVVQQGELRPRFIMDAFNAVLERADPDLETGKIKIVSGDYVQSVLSQHVIVSHDDHGA